MMRSWTDATVAKLPVQKKRYHAPDPSLPGHYVRVLPTGAKSYAAVTRDPGGTQRWVTIGSTALLTLDAARDAARAAMRSIKAGADHKPAAMFDEIADQWLARMSKKLRPRSLAQYRMHVERMKKAWAGRTFDSIRRGDLKKLIDKVADTSGARAAHYIMQTFRPMAKQYLMHHESYIMPVVPGMSGYSPKKHERDRTLTDGELVKLWQVTSDLSPYSSLLRLLLLTGQREDKLATMQWDDVSPTGVWTVRTEPGEKGNIGEVQLPAWRSIIRQQDRYASNPHVFVGRGSGPFRSWSHNKREVDAKLEFKKAWRLHDLRRSVRSMLSALITHDHAERVSGPQADRRGWRLRPARLPRREGCGPGEAGGQGAGDRRAQRCQRTAKAVIDETRIWSEVLVTPRSASSFQPEGSR